MKQLIWKEWYELRLLPVGACLCTAQLLIIFKVYDKTYGGITAEMIAGMLPNIFLLFTILAGAGLISQEVGTSTLQLLTSLPSSRGRVWWVKATAAFSIVIFSILCSAVVWAGTCRVLFHGLLKSVMHQIQRESLGNILLGLIVALLILLAYFTLALAISSFFDRPLTASVAAIVLCAASTALFFSVVNTYDNAIVGLGSGEHDGIRFSAALLVFSIATYAAVSYWTFTRGESLKTAKRFRVAGLTGAACLGLGSTVFLGGYLLHAW